MILFCWLPLVAVCYILISDLCEQEGNLAGTESVIRYKGFFFGCVQNKLICV